MLASFFVTLAVSLTVIYLSIRYESWHSHLSHDHDLEGVQKFHHNPTPRIGGVGVYLSLWAGAACYWLLYNETVPAIMLLAALPAFVGGIIEDLTKKVPPRDRLILTFVAAGIGFYLLDAQLIRTDIPWLDSLLGNSTLVLLITVIAVGGVSHSVNIIDGFNGLMTGYSLLAFAALALVSTWVGDELLIHINLLAIASILGLFLFNYPRGKIFAGDGGAYLIGFLLAESALLLVSRNPEVSPWCAFLILLYPVFEVLFSIYRRRILKGVAMSEPDNKHLHTLIYRRIIKLKGKQKHITNKSYLNSMTSKYLWSLALVSLLPAVVFWRDSVSLILCCAAFSLTYVTSYWRIVRFKGRHRVMSRRRRKPPGSKTTLEKVGISNAPENSVR